MSDRGPPPAKKDKVDAIPVVEATQEIVNACKYMCIILYSEPPLTAYSVHVAPHEMVGVVVGLANIILQILCPSKIAFVELSTAFI